ncbi:MAG: hypothetical protein HZA27_00665 [Candidatus Omnitrophica bacterium]|nr:hypothetical protein [Candidatus Omnitrophota bacterium]
MSKDNFFGRNNYLAILEKRITDLKEGYRQNLAIIGDELVGKTSLIFKFLDKFHDKQIIILYLETRPESLETFARRFMGALLYNFLINSGTPLREDLGFLMDRSKKYIPKTVEKIESILIELQKRKRNNIFTQLLSLCDAINQETGKSCVVILDEFQNLEAVGNKGLYREWSKLLILQKKTLYIIISSLKFKTKVLLSKDLSLLFGNFQTLAIEPFDVRTSHSYLDYRLDKTNIEKGYKDFIIHFTGGYPFYLKVISDALLTLEKKDLVDIIEGLLFEPAGILNQRFSNYIKRFLDSPHSQDYISLLHAIASGQNKIKDIAHILRKPVKEINIRINRLLELDTLMRCGDLFKINDRLFSFWLKFVYQEKINSLTFDAKNQKAVFRENINGLINDFLLKSKEPIAERITELLRLFQDESVRLQSKRLRLDHLREIKPLEFNYHGLKDGLLGRSNDSLWIMGFKYDLLTEEDISEFAKECKKYRHKAQKKIIIALQDIDTNASLRALEEKILTWDLNNLNQILDLFYQPRVIV